MKIRWSYHSLPDNNRAFNLFFVYGHECASEIVPANVSARDVRLDSNGGQRGATEGISFRGLSKRPPFGVF